MSGYSYRIVPAPERARKVRGAKTPEAKFAATLEEDLNALAEDGWEFLRTETFPVEERAGFTGRKTVERRVMVFRRPLGEPAEPASFASASALSQPERETFATAPEPLRGPRILGRPVPPVTRLPRADTTRSEAD